mmetsp:Transcript_52318/g.86935  ORF Transcript_52318/g.86935 Transcript_52318/m.86935 type:complete len:174 (-) Transcript_52318:66-587(-)
MMTKTTRNSSNEAPPILIQNTVEPRNPESEELSSFTGVVVAGNSGIEELTMTYTTADAAFPLLSVTCTILPFRRYQNENSLCILAEQVCHSWTLALFPTKREGHGGIASVINSTDQGGIAVWRNCDILSCRYKETRDRHTREDEGQEKNHKIEKTHGDSTKANTSIAAFCTIA